MPDCQLIGPSKLKWGSMLIPGASCLQVLLCIDALSLNGVVCSYHGIVIAGVALC